MKKAVLSAGIMAILFVGCSVDAEELLKNRLAEPEVTTSSVCFSCADQLGFNLEICSNMDGTYTLLYKDVEVKTNNAEELEGMSPREFVAEGCKGIPDFES